MFNVSIDELQNLSFKCLDFSISKLYSINFVINKYINNYTNEQKLTHSDNRFCSTTIDIGYNINISIYNRIAATIGPPLWYKDGNLFRIA